MYQRYHKTGKVAVTGVTQETVIKIQKELEHVCQGKEKYIKWTARCVSETGIAVSSRARASFSFLG